MNSTIQKWGNSQGIRLPKIILDELGFAENDRVEITVVGNSIMLKKAAKQKHITVKERLEAFYKKSISEIETTEAETEIDTGNAAGEEIW
ncbi:MAG: AbrB/MazE/SpoVT family DNA-binding domain-containing protein [Clostridia bacterium]|nr:AbrB/MazE/SpoVT family DNA-binding domain-containing protein [Clostridia bacterium]